MGDGDGSDAYDDRDQTGSSSDSDETDRQPGENIEAGTAEDARTDHEDDSASDRKTSGPQYESEPSERRSARDSTLSSSGRDGSNPRDESENQVTIENDGIVRWFLKTDDGTVLIVRDVLTSVAIVAIIGLILFGISGIWPPLVAVESGSMDPNMKEGDLVFVVDDDRFVGDNPVDGTGVVTLENGQESGHDKFGMHGDVVVFQPGGSATETPVIHRAHFWVDEGDDWVAQADPDIIGEDVTCDDVQTCPAEHEGFITKGDNNAGYDQQANAGTRSDSIVHPEWVTGKASFRIPWLGNIRLLFDDYLLGIASGSSPITPEAVGAVSIGASGAGGAVAIAGRRQFERY
ncbi:S26 family signal peptidase [Halostagnicola sp. A-GB9-2]|uniref:S26 family signal peptidase n=1 Tax=Halostagnicola sp. A-GB9-2 TaxID=3048066 RepID=UPI0024C09847|nr:S26 family signal peptidase [Halostagnicola sp. A-GB9-2]MDJ1432755.1 S26 family signal peptidase [Halostagnicola sp. A-GB9-2]